MAQEAATTDPVLEHVLLGDSVSDGVFGRIAFGIDPTVSRTMSAAAVYGAKAARRLVGRVAWAMRCRVCQRVGLLRREWWKGRVDGWKSR